MQQQENIDFEHILEEAGIRVTAVRLLVLKAIYTQIKGAFSLHDVVDVLRAFCTLSTMAQECRNTVFADAPTMNIVSATFT